MACSPIEPTGESKTVSRVWPFAASIVLTGFFPNRIAPIPVTRECVVKSMTRSLPSVCVSVMVHLAFLCALMFIPRFVPALAKELQLESIFTEELPQEEITRELELDTRPAESLNVIAGGTPSTTVGAAAQPASAPVNVQKAAVMKEVNLRPVLTDIAALPSDDAIAEELGEGEIIGEVGAMVEGYGAAMGIITQEIVRMMRENKVTVIWLFDESGSMVDDRAEIKENYLRVYEELGIATKQDENLRRDGEQLLTVVASYGAEIHEHTPRPTADPDVIKKAIDAIQNDTTGTENLSQSVAKIIRDYKAQARRRKLAVIIVSDESGDDGDFVEAAVQEARAAKAPIYCLGRESMFGFPYARQRWIDEPTKEEFWIAVRRGPETPYPECLQWNGLHARWDVQNAGFGPYEQVRMARETGGIFFVLPGDEETLVGQGANDKRKYDFLSMRQYQPDLVSRPEYVRDRATSEFRETLWQVIARLNPNDEKLLFPAHDPELNIRHHHYSIELQAFQSEARAEVGKTARAMNLTEEAIALLEKVRPLRDREADARWRASYDLVIAQLYMFRLRLYQFLLAMDKHAREMPAPANPMSNQWWFDWDRNGVIVPSVEQYERLSASFGLKMSRDEYLQMVESEQNSALERMNKVIADHPGTPWARRAEYEIAAGFGFRVHDVLWNPSGRRNEAERRLPKL